MSGGTGGPRLHVRSATWHAGTMGRPLRRDALRRSYDAIAGDYADRLRDELAYKPLDRALLAAVVEEAGPGAHVADLGCGPGHVAGWLELHGGRPVGIDLSAQMIAIARREHPGIEFRQGDLVALPAADEEFSAVIALYSIIHMPAAERHRAFEEMRRVLRPEGKALVAFHVGDEVRHLTEWWGHTVDVDGWYLDPDAVVAEMGVAGLVVEGRLVRTHYPAEVATRRAYLFGRRPVG